MELNELVWLQGTGPGGREADKPVASRRSLSVPCECAVDPQSLGEGGGHGQHGPKAQVAAGRAVASFTPHILDRVSASTSFSL